MRRLSPFIAWLYGRNWDYWKESSIVKTDFNNSHPDKIQLKFVGTTCNGDSQYNVHPYKYNSGSNEDKTPSKVTKNLDWNRMERHIKNKYRWIGVYTWFNSDIIVTSAFKGSINDIEYELNEYYQNCVQNRIMRDEYSKQIQTQVYVKVGDNTNEDIKHSV